MASPGLEAAQEALCLTASWSASILNSGPSAFPEVVGTRVLNPGAGVMGLLSLSQCSVSGSQVESVK